LGRFFKLPRNSQREENSTDADEGNEHPVLIPVFFLVGHESLSFDSRCLGVITGNLPRGSFWLTVKNDTYSPWFNRHCQMSNAGMTEQADILVRFGQRVRDLRSEQENFAYECELDRSYMGGIERGERNVALRNLEKIAETLGITLAELFEGV